ncbi:MAG: DUF4167 domain-containing protein [Nitratireductor sp.]
MRPQQQKNRMRGRGRKQPNPLSRNYESNGPDVKIRGNASHIAEKYSQLARDAQSAGDRVMAENYLQHAEHYFRIIAASQAAQRNDDQPGAGYDRSNQSDYDGDDDDGYGDNAMEDRPLRSQDNRANDGRGNNNRGQDRQSRDHQPRDHQGRDNQRGERSGNNNRRNVAGDTRNRGEETEGFSSGDEGANDQPVIVATEVAEAPVEAAPVRETRSRNDARPRRRPRNDENGDGEAAGNGDVQPDAAPRVSRRPARREGASADAAALPESLFAPMPAAVHASRAEVASDD